MIYLQRKGRADLQETVDEFEEKKEAKDMLAKYQVADPEGYYYISRKPCKDWKENKEMK